MNYLYLDGIEEIKILPNMYQISISIMINYLESNKSSIYKLFRSPLNKSGF